MHCIGAFSRHLLCFEACSKATPYFRHCERHNFWRSALSGMPLPATRGHDVRHASDRLGGVCSRLLSVTLDISRPVRWELLSEDSALRPVLLFGATCMQLKFLVL